MMRYSVHPRDRIFIKGQNISKNMSKNLGDKYNQKLLDYAKQSAIDALKTTSKKASIK